jgi:hypothetical protein
MRRPADFGVMKLGDSLRMNDDVETLVVVGPA